MAKGEINFLWDTCVVRRLLNEKPPEYLDDIKKWVGESRDNRATLYISSFLYAEIRPSNVKKPGVTPLDILNGLDANFVPVDGNPDIMSMAGALAMI